ncbi:MAG: PEP-CTERM sorting domain-containing protein [Phycisphaerae bacterium]|nr:PEP-CTERM sorting domain-containing protein [Phycisphaerae bacterium]
MKCCALILCGVIVWVLSAVPAWGDTVTLFIDPGSGSTENTGATATLVFEFSEVGADDFLSVRMQNTTPEDIGSSLTAVGFELPDSLSLSVSFAPGGASSYFDELTFDECVLPGWMDAPGGYDLMLTSDGNFQGGNPNGAPTAGESQTVLLALGDTGLTADQLATTFSDFYTGLTDHFVIGRFQAVGPDGEDSDMVGGYIPEPGTLVLLMLGGTGFLARRAKG